MAKEPLDTVYTLWAQNFVKITLSYTVSEISKIFINKKNSIRDARTPQPGKIVFNTMRYKSYFYNYCSETVHRLGYYQSSVTVQVMFK